MRKAIVTGSDISFHMYFILVILVVFASGCSHSLTVKNLEEYYSRGIDSRFDGSLCVSKPSGSPGDIPYFKAILKSLEEDYGLTIVRHGSVLKVAEGRSCDYSLSISIETKYNGSGKNFVITFPGFILFAPSWKGFYYDAKITTEVFIRDTAGKTVSKVFEEPLFQFNYMDSGRSFWAYNGWWTPMYGAGSLIAAPFMCSYDKDATPAFQLMVLDIYGQYIAEHIIEAMNDLAQNR